MLSFVILFFFLLDKSFFKNLINQKKGPLLSKYNMVFVILQVFVKHEMESLAGEFFGFTSKECTSDVYAYVRRG